jgi:hypothetical protein
VYRLSEGAHRSTVRAWIVCAAIRASSTTTLMGTATVVIASTGLQKQLR